MRPETRRIYQPEQPAALQIRCHHGCNTLAELFFGGEGNNGDRNLGCAPTKNFDIECGVRIRARQPQKKDNSIAVKSAQANLHGYGLQGNSREDVNYTSHSW